MSRRARGYLLLGGGLLALAAATAAVRRLSGIAATPENAEWLARIILTEAHRPLSAEGAAIGQVVINRARRALVDRSIRGVLGADGGKWFGAAHSPGWYTATGDAITRRTSWPAALALAGALLRGEPDDLIGAREFFVHPWGFDACASNADCGSWRCGSFPNGVGQRCVPARHVARADGGTAPHAPLWIYPATFS